MQKVLEHIFSSFTINSKCMMNGSFSPLQTSSKTNCPEELVSKNRSLMAFEDLKRVYLRIFKSIIFSFCKRVSWNRCIWRVFESLKGCHKRVLCVRGIWKVFKGLKGNRNRVSCVQYIKRTLESLKGVCNHVSWVRSIWKAFESL